METFRTIGVQKIIEDKDEWIHIVSDVKGFIPSLVDGFYANIF